MLNVLSYLSTEEALNIHMEAGLKTPSTALKGGIIHECQIQQVTFYTLISSIYFWVWGVNVDLCFQFSWTIYKAGKLGTDLDTVS